jgi:hypothetical protein
MYYSEMHGAEKFEVATTCIKWNPPGTERSYGPLLFSYRQVSPYTNTQFSPDTSMTTYYFVGKQLQSAVRLTDRRHTNVKRSKVSVFLILKQVVHIITAVT